MKFNVNNYVKVRLTDYGREILYKEWLKFQKTHPDIIKKSFTLPEEDSDGWTMFQGWKLMNTFGRYVLPGHKLPFEAEIEIVERK